MRYLTEILDKKHRKSEFTCGKELLDNYLHYQAGQDVKRKLSACFVWEDTDSKLIQGYYTLANHGLPLELVPEEFRKKLPSSYLSIPYYPFRQTSY